MKRIGRVHGNFGKRMAALALAAILAVGMLGVGITAYADSEGKVIASTAKIRQQPNTSSETIGSVESGKTISIKGQTTGSDGYTWYQVYVNSDTLGYIRSDLVTITDGSTPATVQATTTTTTTTTTGGSTPTTSTPDETVVEVTAVNPVSASVSGSSPVRVRQNASTTSRIYATVESGSALTVTGTATGTDGNQWYQVNFISGGSEINGFIRADYVALGGELTEASEDGTEGTETGTEDTGETTETSGTKDWETYQSDDGEWHLQNNTDGNVYSITTIFDTVSKNAEIAENALASKKTMQTVVIILAVVMVAMVAAIGYLIFRLKDLSDSAYYREVEQETLRKRAGGGQQNGRATARANAGGQRVPVKSGGQTVKSGGQGQPRNASAANGQRVPVKSGGQAARTGGQASVQNRTVKASEENVQRSASVRDQGEDMQQRPVTSPDEQIAPKAQEKTQTAERNEKRGANAQGGQMQKPAWKSKNFVAADDEFEFEFLNWDGGDE